MTDPIRTLLAEIEAVTDKAVDEVAALCTKLDRMSVPANPERDSDHILVLTAALAISEALREVVEAVLGLHRATHYCLPFAGHAGYGNWYEDASAYPWPCPTVAAIAAKPAPLLAEEPINGR